MNEEPESAEGVISADQAEMLARQTLKNIVDKVASGLVPNKREAALIEQATSKAKVEGKSGKPRRINDIPETITSSLVLASFLGISDSTVRLLAAAKSITGFDESGNWPFQENVMSYCRLLKEESKGYPARLAQTKAEQAAIELEIVKIERAKKKGELIPRDDYTTRWIDGIVKIRQTIEGAAYLTTPQKKKLLASIKKTALAKLPIKGE